MANYRFQVALGATSGIERDRFVNVWHTKDALGTATAASAQDAIFAFATFYNGVGNYMPEQVVSEALGAHSIKAYALSVGAGGPADDVSVLLTEDTFTTPTLQPSSAVPHPGEVACCISLAADPDAVPEFSGGTRPRSRRRGRVYLGPLANYTTIAAVSGSSLRPTAGFRTNVLGFLDELVTDLNAVGHELCVYSRSDAQMRTVTEASMDDAFDTVRSRGIAPTVRTTVVITQP